MTPQEVCCVHDLTAALTEVGAYAQSLLISALRGLVDDPTSSRARDLARAALADRAHFEDLTGQPAPLPEVADALGRLIDRPKDTLLHEAGIAALLRLPVEATP